MKTILITGASSGIGRAAAELFLANGWQVGALARRREMLDELADRYDAAIPLAADVTDAAAVQTAFDTFVARAGRIAGAPDGKALARLPVRRAMPSMLVMKISNKRALNPMWRKISFCPASISHCAR